jgi:hypothetical protein
MNTKFQLREQPGEAGNYVMEILVLTSSSLLHTIENIYARFNIVPDYGMD